MFLFSSQFIKTDVTSVAVLKYFTLTGIGGCLHVFESESKKLLQVINVFEGGTIQGIVFNNNDTLLVYGGQLMKIYNVNNFKQFHETCSKVGNDWILDAKWIHKGTKIATVSMHNKLYIWNSNLELETELECEEKCILYSAHICYDTYENLIILSGTIFSEVLIWKPTERKNNNCIVLKRLKKHKGVIFSIDYNDEAGVICSSSDDRSAILWKVRNKSLTIELQQKYVNIYPVCQVYGHSSRIFRCRVLDKYFITAGEDSVLNIWSFEGQLVRKIETHQDAPIWAIDYDENQNYIITGGGDSGVTAFRVNFDFIEEHLALARNQAPKSIKVLVTGNVAILSETGTLYYYSQSTKKLLQTEQLDDLRSYALFEISSCRNLIALAGFHGQIYIYKDDNNKLAHVASFRTKCNSRIFSFHWLSCESFLICQSGGIISLFYLKRRNIIPVRKFILPASKERWTTTAAFKNNIIVGDRRGNIHLYDIQKVHPVQTIEKVHNHLGVTNLITQKQSVVSLGRNGLIKRFSYNNNNGALKLISSDKLPFSWLLNIVDNLLLGFSGNNFLIWDIESKRILFEKPCGGGHRSWDFFKNSNNISFIYVKDKIIHRIYFYLSAIIPVDLVPGFHQREINSVKAVRCFNDYILISGGEDTCIKISLNQSEPSRFENLVTLKSHLSSIRAITTYKIPKEFDETTENYLVISAGGRAQIVCWKLQFTVENNHVQSVSCSEQHSYYKVIDCEESEMRIMDVCVTEIQNKTILLCACSDGNIEVFFIETKDDSYFLSAFKNIFYKLKCILRLTSFQLSNKNVLVTMATDGKLVFWDITGVLTENNLGPIHSIETHQSGINGYSYQLLENNFCLFLTGGDDNAIVLNYIKFNETNCGVTVQSVDKLIVGGMHCAQITGAFLHTDYFVTASIDQKILLFKWTLISNKVNCVLVSRYKSSISDIQGIESYASRDMFEIFIYGKGIEFIKISKK